MQPSGAVQGTIDYALFGCDHTEVTRGTLVTYNIDVQTETFRELRGDFSAIR
jgi:hypothetical protein